ncbi:MAG: glycerophosphodiester phosphodiesterase [Sphingomonadales bacterium]|nr:glycerophosphodiester phosphodiesterase [Sphingomonadales bacterium]
MKVWLGRIALVLAIAFLVSTFINASWIAPEPRGYPRLIAHRGVMQQFGSAQGCTATQIEQPVNDFIENTVPSYQMARRLGAQMIEVDVTPTADGRFVLFHDESLDCRTDGHGPVRLATLAGLKALDAGFGYTADGGKTFPLRGKGAGLIPSLEEGLAAAGDTALLYNLRFDDPAAADRLVDALKAAGRDPVASRDAFSAPESALTRIRAAWPKAWAYNDESVEACTRAYLARGWLGLTPDACRNGTIAVPINRQWLFAGWPNRLLARMAAVGAHVIVIGPYHDGKPVGLDLPEQIGDVPLGYNGAIWVDDINVIGPALKPALNKRNPVEEAELAKTLEARRAKKARD